MYISIRDKCGKILTVGELHWFTRVCFNDLAMFM